jgi:hypothetical protein
MRSNPVQNLHHFDSIDAPVHTLVSSIQKTLQLNKKVASKGEWSVSSVRPVTEKI